ncbi:hypothetical protein ACFOWA_20285 [Pedobacter lithocola]|uniref:Wadjet protein JetD C-terminal domain-containing protein n=1 Tax=Pedobacter lithocola TaxID=1908239 RepID=A0ABV8PDZ1_9SPHI
MQNQVFRNFIRKILNEEKISFSSIAASIKGSSDFNTLINGGFIAHMPAITGGGSIYLKNRIALEKYYAAKFPGVEAGNTAIGNIHAFRNTKAGKRQSQNIVLIRGKKPVLLNELTVDLSFYTGAFGAFSSILLHLETDKICFVENLDSFLLAEQVIGDDFTFIHTYGGIGASVVQKIKAEEILVFPDYDFIGLHTFLMVKNIFHYTKLFVPDNYKALYDTKSRTIKTKQGREQQPSKQVLECNEEIVVKIRTDIFEQKKFLEQQALFK